MSVLLGSKITVYGSYVIALSTAVRHLVRLLNICGSILNYGIFVKKKFK